MYNEFSIKSINGLVVGLFRAGLHRMPRVVPISVGLRSIYIESY